LKTQQKFLTNLCTDANLPVAEQVTKSRPASLTDAAEFSEAPRFRSQMKKPTCGGPQIVGAARRPE
jgi:hypothetical protein